MDAFLLEYLPILLFIGIGGLGIGAGSCGAALSLAPSKPDPEKLSAYECGFPAFDDARMKFDVRFYLVSILSWCSPWLSILFNSRHVWYRTKLASISTRV